MGEGGGLSFFTKSKKKNIFFGASLYWENVTVQTRMIKSAIYPPCLCGIGPDTKRWVLRRRSESSCKLGDVTAGQISATDRDTGLRSHLRFIDVVIV